MINKQLKTDPYLTEHPARLLVGSTNQIMAYVNRTWPDLPLSLNGTESGVMVAREDEAGYVYHYICLIAETTKQEYSPAQVAGILGHEIAHLVFRMFTSRGILISEENDEAFCYYQEWLLIQCLAILERVKWKF